MDKRFIYADNAATTRISDEVLEAMLPWLKDGYGNPSSIYGKGREAAQAIIIAREQTAAAIGATAAEIFFTASGTESDNWAIKGVAKAKAKDGKNHLITTAFEHHAVSHSMEALANDGFEVTYLPVGKDGIVCQVKSCLKNCPVLPPVGTVLALFI